MDSSLRTALQESGVRVFIAVKIEFNSGPTVRMLDCSGEVTFSVNGSNETFTGLHPTYGAIGSLDGIEERVAEEAPRFRFIVFPPNQNAGALWGNPLEQGSPVSVWLGTRAPNGTINGAPELLWKGRLDTVKLALDDTSQALEIDTVSAFERMFVAEEAARLNGVFHKSIWGGETGLDYVYVVDEVVHWGNGNQGGTTTGPRFGGGRGGGVGNYHVRTHLE